VTNVRLTIEDHVATVTIARPGALNAIDSVTANQLQGIWAQLEANADVRVIVLTGEGERAFCVGADLKEESGSGLNYWANSTPGGFGGLALRETLDIPVIARVNGYALGGGFEMMLGTDIVVAVEDAKFGLPEPLVGHIPLDGGAVLLQRQIPYRLAMGLINEVAARAELDAAVARWVKAILACSPTSLRAIKQCVRRTATLSPAEAQRARLPALMAALTSDDAQEGVRAFREKRPPVWTGK